MTFVLKKRIDLSSLGEDWKECYLEFSSPSFADVSSVPSDADDNAKTRAAIQMLEKLFVDGRGFDGKEVVAIGKEDIKELPLQILTMCFSEIAGPVPKGDER